MTETIYIELEDEGVIVYRPAPAYRTDGGKYIVLRPSDYDISLEKWAFPPGSVVECERKTTSEGEILAAVRSVDTNLQPGKKAM